MSRGAGSAALIRLLEAALRSIAAFLRDLFDGNATGSRRHRLASGAASRGGPDAALQQAGDDPRATTRRRLVYVPEIQPDTFLYFFFRGATGRSYSFRDYSSTTGIQITYASDYSHNAEEILEMAELDFDAPAHDADDLEFWHDHIQELNRRHLAGRERRAAEPPPAGEPSKSGPSSGG